MQGRKTDFTRTLEEEGKPSVVERKKRMVAVCLWRSVRDIFREASASDVGEVLDKPFLEEGRIDAVGALMVEC